MSTLPGLASKGEKEKSKFQSLDINKLYRVTLGESSENKQQKSTLSQKHGMQSLGKVPNTRRPPANLPSLKSEHSGADTAVSLVPSNGSGWGKQESTVQTSTTTTVQQTSNNVNVSAPIVVGAPQLTAHQVAIALPVTTTIQPANKLHPPSANPATNLDKSWSSVMIGNDPNAVHPPPYHSPQFQHEFPSLSAGDGAPPRAVTDTQYAPGLSLRPQTEGSWLQGGSRAGVDGVRGSSAQPAGPPPHSGPAGQPLPPQVRGFVPNFMYRGSSYPANGHGGPLSGSILPSQPPPQAVPPRRPDQRHHRNNDLEELAHRPIIKEEDLSGMDNLTGDMGWAINDDIDYNQKLAFSDDELKPDNKDTRKVVRTNKDYDKTDSHPQQETDHKPSWNNNSSGSHGKSSQLPRGRHEDDEFLAQRRRQQQEIANAVERAKQRKEEEEKKFLETRQAAAKKLQELDERLGKSKRDKEVDDSCGTINPASVPPQTIAPVPILLPEWEREKEVRSKPQSGQHHDDDGKHKASHRDSDFKHLTQIEGRATFSRKEPRSADKDAPSGGVQQQHSNFSKQFQSNLPPRFLKQQQLNAQSSFNYENRWSQSGSRSSPSNRKGRDDDKDLEDRYRRQDDGYRLHRYDSGRKSSDSRYEDYKERDYDFKPKDDDKMGDRVRERHEKGDYFDGMSISRQGSDEWHGDKRTDKYDRPQRPDSRDSRASRESRHSVDSTRHSEPREYTSWAEEPIEEKKKEHRMVVPGPITKEKIEADDLRSEKRNLTQLKRGSMPDKKLDKTEKADGDENWSIMKKDSIDEPKAWADSIPPAVEKELLKAKEEKRDEDDEKKERFVDKDDKKHPGGRGRSDSQGSRQGWSGNVQVYRNSWSSNKKNPPPPTRPTRGGRTVSKGQDMTESEGSADDASVPIENGPSPKPSKKLEKDEKNKEMRCIEKQPLSGDRSKLDKNHFVPRGEPSRHGRGAASAGVSFRGSRGGSKRVDTYGPPAKSPFSNIDDKEKKHDDSEEDKSKSLPKDSKTEDKNRKKIDPRKTKPKQDGDGSDNSDADGRKSKNSQRSSMQSMPSRRGGSSAPPRQAPSVDKRGFGGPRAEMPHRQNSSGSLQPRKDKDGKDKDPNVLSSAIADISLKDIEDVEINIMVGDCFQEVKCKKTDRKIEKGKDDKPKPPAAKPEKDLKKPERNSKGASQISQQQVASIPSLMATPVNPPANMPPQSQIRDNRDNRDKLQFDRNRQNKTLPPRFAKAKEHSRIQKVQMQQGMCDEISKVNSNIYGLKEALHVSSSMNSNAWDKPLSAQLRAVDQEIVVPGMEACKSLEATLHHPTTDDKAVLDSSKPLNTIIFENTNYKSVPGARGRNDKPRCNKMEEGMDSLTNFNKPIGELLGKDKSDIQIRLFNKEDSADMKLDFLESEISQITEDKSSKIGLSRSNMGTSNNILTADALNMKIQSVKKVWESNIPNVMEHNSDDSFPSSFVADPNAMDANTAFSKGSEVPDENHDVYNSSPNANASNSTTNVCKVKPTQQVAGAGGQTLLNAGTHQPHSNIVGPALMGHALSSPPPIQPVMGGLGQPQQQYTASQHISYQAGLGNNQYGGIPAPSPPTVLYNSTQQLQQTAGLYAPFQIDQSQVMSSQGRSQFSQYSFNLSQTGSSPYSQSMYMQTGQPHAPPNPQQDLYQNINSYRLPNTGPFGQNQQVNNPTTVLISSTSNSLMSPSVKPSNQQISAIGTKAGGVGQAYQQQSQQGQQLYIPFDPSITGNYMQSAGVIQRGPGGPVQNNVVAGLQPSGLQPSSSFYSGSTAGQAGYFQGPGSSTLPSPIPQHQTGFGIQQSVFPTHNQSHTNAGMQNYPTPYISGQMQLAAAAMSQRYSANMQNPQYMKSQIGDQGRQQLKSPGSQQQEVLSSVFNSGSQIASPKSRQQMKQPPPQPSPTTHKYLYGGMSNQQGGQTRYPTPIQRPAGNYQNQMGNVQNISGNSNQKSHRMNNSNNRSSGGRQFYSPQGGNMNTQSDKAEESKLGDGVNTSNPASTGSSSKPPATVSQSGDKADAKEENCAKD